jgi:sugar phosphate isomerase/epimerase
MLDVGVQTKNVVYDDCPGSGFALLASAGFSGADFSLNAYLDNTSIYTLTDSQSPLARSAFFSQSVQALERFFAPHKKGAQAAGISISQMHMPYPIHVPEGNGEWNAYLWNEVAPKSLHVCCFLECPYIVFHGVKLARRLGAEEAEWEHTLAFIDSIAPLAKELGITICMENLYESIGGRLVEGPCCDAKKAAERIDRVNEKYHAQVLGFCFDTGHANLVGIDFEKFMSTLDYRLKVFHVHDNDGAADLHQIPFTFTRTRENMPATDWEGFRRGLANIKFDGVLSFETAPVLSAFPDEMKEDVLRFISRIGRYLGAFPYPCPM